MVKERVLEFIKKERLLRRGDAVCVAVSGGVDSTVLLHLLNSIKTEMDLRLIVCHLNHNLRGVEAARDQNFVKKLAKSLGLAFVGKKLLKKDINARRGESLQEWARGRRLEFLSECADKYSSSVGPRRVARIALGHNMDDQSETILMRLVKGASLRGLCGIAPKRGRFIRPVLGLTRAEIDGYARAESIDFVEDSSNKTKKYLRNKIRHELMPLLTDYNPLVREAVARSAELLREDEAFLHGVAEAAFKEALIKKTKCMVTFNRKALLTFAPPILRRVFVRAAYSWAAGSSVYRAQVDGFISLLKGRAPNKKIKLCDGLFVSRDYDIVTISSRPPRALARPGGEAVLSVPGKAAIKGLKAVVAATTLKKPPKDMGASFDVAYFDCALLKGPLTVRTSIAGDKMRPLGMKGRKKLKDIFIDEKVAIGKRRSTLLVLSGAEIIWAAGLRRSNAALVTADTGRVLKLTLKTP